ncbi:MAG: AAA family ATPase [Kiritimatiellae bacterium]|nr:AAA family ATPase [Kiritimatiellia bacterium]
MQNATQNLRPINDVSDDFAELRKHHAIYVDKTSFIHELVSDENSKVVFVSRPRRFGKSLTVSTLKYLFQGRRDLFTGLAIDRSDWEWKKHPVIHFAFNDVITTTVSEFADDFVAYVKRSMMNAGYEYDEKLSCAQNFGIAIETLAERSRKAAKENPAEFGEGVVILIDEYDAPVGHCLADIPKAEAVRDRMSSFYAQMKNRTGDIRFLFMTGVSKFTKLSVFSALSNIKDVSMLDKYATMFGYTEEELTQYFEPHLRAHAAKMGLPYDDYRAEMKRWFNGFRFAKNDETTVYNPISVAYTLKNQEPSFTAAWATTGRPSMLMNFLKREDVLRIDPEGTKKVRESAFDVAELRNLQPIPILYQSGYLTIKGYNPQTRQFVLGVPDEEVRQDLCMLMTGVAADKSAQWASSLGDNLLAEEWDDFYAGLKSLYAAMAYGPTEGSVHENSYGRCLSFLLASCGFSFRMEDVQSDGRADIVADHPALTCIFELKVGEPVDKAFAQIREKGYAEPYLASGKPVWAIGLSFDRASRRLVGHEACRLA